MMSLWQSHCRWLILGVFAGWIQTVVYTRGTPLNFIMEPKNDGTQYRSHLSSRTYFCWAPRRLSSVWWCMVQFPTLIPNILFLSDRALVPVRQNLLPRVGLGGTGAARLQRVRSGLAMEVSSAVCKQQCHISCQSPIVMTMDGWWWLYWIPGRYTANTGRSSGQLHPNPLTTGSTVSLLNPSCRTGKDCPSLP